MLTRETLRSAKVIQAHVRMTGGGGVVQMFPEYPRLSSLARRGTNVWAVDSRPVGSAPHKRAENELHVERMKAVRATLVWLHDNEASIKQRASY